MTAKAQKIQPRFRRSVRVDDDFNASASVDGFRCPASFANVITSMCTHIRTTGQAAFTWTGPFGGGKSSLALALAALVAGRSSRKAAEDAFGPAVTKSVRAAFRGSPGSWRVVPVVCDRRRSLRESILSALKATVEGAPLFAADTGSRDALAALAKQLEASNLLVFVDELGRALSEASQSAADLDFLQDVAELATRSEGRLVFVGILHQAFHEYAQGSDREARERYAKIQGRFVDLIVSTGAEEALELIGDAIAAPNSARKEIAPLARAAAELIGRDDGSRDRLAAALEKCAPLHPVTACLLSPMSRRRFGQNQRSVFAFLNSAERHGFQDFLASEATRYTPDLLWDYLQANYEMAILASPDSKHWAMAGEALDRLEAKEADALHVSLLKTVAIVGLFRDIPELAPTPQLLSLCVDADETELRQALRDLQEWSMVVFRRHSGAFGLFAGSDFDIDAAVAEFINQNPDIELSQIRALADLQPRLAKRHHARTGTMRWFDVNVALVSDLEKPDAIKPRPNAVGTIVLAVPGRSETPAEAATRVQAAISSARSFDLVVGLAEQSWRLAELTRELAALSAIDRGRPELAGDPIARREIGGRIAELKGVLEHAIERAFASASWFAMGKSPGTLTRSGFQALISELCDARFPDAVCLQNELLNRTSPSSNAVAARTALIKRMVEFPALPRLGLEGFPPEAALYDSILKTTMLHQETETGWGFAAPKKGRGSASVLWKTADKVLSKSDMISAAEIYAAWSTEPIGLKAGLAPVFLAAYVLSQARTIAVYREGIYTPHLSDLLVEVLVRDPRDIQLRRIVLDERSEAIVANIAQAVGLPDDASPLMVARRLVSEFDALAPWTKRTNSLNRETAQFRDFLKRARDPNQLLLEQIGGDRMGGSLTPHEIGREVKIWLGELTSAYPSMLEGLKQLLLKELAHDGGGTDFARLRARAANLRDITGDLRFNAFVLRLAQFTGAATDIEAIASVAADRHTKDWTDADKDKSAFGIATLAAQFLKAEALAHVKGRRSKRTALALVVGRDQGPQSVYKEFSISDDEARTVTDVVQAVHRVMESFDAKSRNVLLAALAELSQHYMQEPQEAGDRVGAKR